jgi:hypothetical protein
MTAKCMLFIVERVGQSVKVTVTETTHYHIHAHSHRYSSEKEAPSSCPQKKVVASNAN